jgi:hypothetical protein
MKRLFALLLFSTLAQGQSIPNGAITQGQVWTPAQWNNAWQSKVDLSQIGTTIPTYPQTAAEIAAGVTPTNYTYPAGNVLRYGADPTGTVSSNTAVANADLALSGVYGGVIYFPKGIYLVTAITISNAADVRGDGIGATQIYAGDATSNVFTATGSSVSFHDFSMSASVTRTAGRYFYATTTSSIVQFYNLYLLNWYFGIDVEGTNYTIRDSILTNGVAASGEGIRIGFDSSPGTLSDIVIDNIKVDNASGARPFACVAIGAAGDVSMIDDNLQHCVQDLSIQPSGSSVVASVYSVNSFFDNAGSYGVFAQPQGSGAAIVRSRFIGPWASSAGVDGMFFDTSAHGGTIDGVDIIGAHVFDNTSQGLSVAGTGTVRVKILGSEIAANTNAGVLINAGVTNFQIQENTIGPSGAFGANNYAIQILAGASNQYEITGNDLCGNTTGALANSGTGLTFNVGGNLCTPGGLSGTTGSIGGGSLANGACSTGTVSVTGSITSMAVQATPVTTPGAGFNWLGYVSTAGTVTVEVCNATGATNTPTASAYNVRVLQ